MSDEITPPTARPMPLIRRPNAEVRGREHLTADEVEKLAQAAGGLGRHGHRDTTMIRVAFRYGLRVSELIAVRRDQLDLKGGQVHVRRVKRGTPSTHPLGGGEIWALRKVLRKYEGSSYVFPSERGGPLASNGVWTIIVRAGEAANLGFSVHPHMLRHACGFKLANDGQDTRAIQHYLGHKTIQHPVRYMVLDADRFKDFWKD